MPLSPNIFLSHHAHGRAPCVITHACGQRKVLADVETFSSHRSIFSSALGEHCPRQQIALGIYE